MTVTECHLKKLSFTNLRHTESYPRQLHLPYQGKVLGGKESSYLTHTKSQSISIPFS